MTRVAIIGNGVAGATAALHIARHPNYSVTIISDESPYFFARTALMYAYMGHIRTSDLKPYPDTLWDNYHIHRIHDRVTDIDFQHKHLHLTKGQVIPYDILILATGSIPHRIDWPGIHLDRVGYLYHLQDLHRLEHWTPHIRHAVIVGGGLIGIELAEMLRSRNKQVTFLVRESHFWNIVLSDSEAQLIDQHIREHGVDLQLNTELEEIVDDGSGKVGAVRTSSGDLIPCQYVGITIGVVPNVQWLQNTPLHIDTGIVVDELLRTNIDDVYAIGDCAQLQHTAPHRRPIEPVWYTARKMGQCVAATVTGNPTPYRQGLWYNSAKFFDIEYQTYGYVPPQPHPDTDDFLWQDPAHYRSLRIHYRRDNHAILGINALGLRLRQEQCHQWIQQATPLPKVISQLHRASFDPEGQTSYIHDIQQQFHAQFYTTNTP